MNVENIIGNNRNTALKAAAVASVITLLVFASGLTSISKPTDADFGDYGGPGYVYTVEYECGTQTSDDNVFAQPGEYSTNILIHNPFSFSVSVHLKKLQETPTLATGVWISTADTGNTITTDGALAVDCSDLRAADNLSTTFYKGVLVISHEITEPNPLEGVLIKQPLFGDESLDVTAAYTFKGTVEIKHFNKVLVKKKVLDNSTATPTVTSTISELLIPAATGTISATTTFDIKDAIDDKLGCNSSTFGRVCEVLSIHYGITNEGESGNSKHVETIKGKFVQFIPKQVTDTV